MDFEILKAQWEDLADWKKLLIVLAISGVLAYLVYLLILTDKIKEKKRLEEELSKKNTELEIIMKNASPQKRAELMAELERQKLETEQLERKLAEVRAKFKPRDDIKRTINFITSIANKQGVIIENINILAQEDVYLQYNPALDRVEAVVKNTSSNQPLEKVKNRLAPRKIVRKQDKKQQNGNTADNTANNQVSTENLVHLKRYKYSISMKGTTKGVVNVIKNIVNTKNFVNVDRVSLSKGEKESRLVNTTLEIVSYAEVKKTGGR